MRTGTAAPLLAFALVSAFPPWARPAAARQPAGEGSRPPAGSPSGRRASDAFIRVNPALSAEVLVNPGKGWILYDDARGSFAAQTPETWAIASLGYVRYSWSDIEKADGVYDWSPIDRSIAECVRHGKKLAFGVMACNPTSREDYTTPRFVHEMPDVRSLVLSVPNWSLPDPAVPGGYRKMKKHVIDFTRPGPGYYRKVDEFARRLAERYGNSPDVEYIDIRCFGSWGENSHAWLYGSSEPGYDEGICRDPDQDQGVNTEVMKRCWRSYIDAFRGKRVRLAVAWGFGCNQCQNYVLKEPFYWAVAQGVALRRDGYSGYRDCRCAEVLWGVDRVPLILEMAAGYAFQRDNHGYDAQRLLESPEQNRASYYPLGAYGPDGDLMLKELKPAVLAVTNRIGYHFALTEALFSASMGKATPATITTKWRNDGVARIHIPAHVAVALIDSRGRVVDRQWLSGVNPREWTCAMDMVDQDKTTSATARFRFGRATPTAKYRLAIGLFTDRRLKEPDIKIGNSGRRADGWTIIYDETKPGPVLVNAAAGGTASASSSLTSATPAANAINAATSRYWSSGRVQTAWLAIDLGSTRSVSCVEVDWGSRYARDVVVQTSATAPSPGARWVDAAASRTGRGGRQTVRFAARGARSVRIVCRGSALQPPAHRGLGPFVGENIVVNGGFERGLASWRDYAEGRAAALPTQTEPRNARSGRTTLRLTGQSEVSIRQSLTTAFELTGPGRYAISFDVCIAGDGGDATFALGTRGSRDDKRVVPWWEPTQYHGPDLPVPVRTGRWQPVRWEGDVLWAGLIEMVFLELRATAPGDIDAWFDNVRVAKVSPMRGERAEKHIPDEGSFTIRALRVW